MKIAILSIGSEGDIRPYIALGQELHRLGNQVHLVTHESAQERIQAAGLQFADIGENPVVNLKTSELGKAVDEAGTFSKMNAVTVWFQALLEDWFQKGKDALTTIQPDFCVLGTFPMNIHSTLVQDVLKIPMCQIHLAPFIPTTEHAPPVGFGNAETWFACTAKLKWTMVLSAGFNMLYAAPLAKCYAQYDIKPTSESITENWKNTPAVLGYSDILSPRPKDYDEDLVSIVGPLMDSSSSSDIDSFLDTKDGQTLQNYFDKAPRNNRKPIVFVGFGSMWETITDSERKTLWKAIMGSSKLLSTDTYGFIVQCDKATLPEATLPSNVVAISSAPHDWLFPQVDIVACHGGAGTTHKALLHGCATVVCPVKPSDSDQPFWGGCVARAGLGVDGPCATRLTESSLATAIQSTLSDPSMNTRVQAASDKMKGQDGITNAAKAILKFAAYK